MTRWNPWAFALLSLTALSSGCGPDARRMQAMEALETARSVVTELEVRTSGGEASPEVIAALDLASARLIETEHAYDLWGGSTGSRAFERMAACLSNALGDLRSALSSEHLVVPADLETAEVSMGAFTERPCSRPRE
jgi:hypothetical protein